MISLGHVCSEGGPILVADAGVAQNWRGACDEGSDYRRVLELLPSHTNPGAVRPIAIGNNDGIIWDMGGAGTVDIFRAHTGLILVRAWLDCSDEPAALREMAVLPMQYDRPATSINISSTMLAILWTPETGECITHEDLENAGRPTGEMCTGSSAILVAVSAGEYDCYADEVSLDGRQVGRRLHIFPQNHRPRNERLNTNADEGGMPSQLNFSEFEGCF